MISSPQSRIEFKIPLTDRRVDLMLSGYDAAGTANVVVMELKQWDGESTECVPGNDGIVKTFVGGDVRKTIHPSYQAWSYATFLQDFNGELRVRGLPDQPSGWQPFSLS